MRVPVLGPLVSPTPYGTPWRLPMAVAGLGCEILHHAGPDVPKSGLRVPEPDSPGLGKAGSEGSEAQPVGPGSRVPGAFTRRSLLQLGAAAFQPPLSSLSRGNIFCISSFYWVLQLG